MNKNKKEINQKVIGLFDGISETKCFKGKGNILMNFSVCFYGEIWISGFRLIKSSKGNFISFPQSSYVKDGETVYTPIAWLDGDTFTSEDKKAFGDKLLELAMEDFKEL